MITRRHQKEDAASEAVYSNCESYRYSLTQLWGPGQRLLCVMLNPSTATETQNDPTIERCERRARSAGFGALRVVNLFAFRATDPKRLSGTPDPVGPANDATLAESVAWSDLILCGWGQHGHLLGRAALVEAWLRGGGWPLYHLGLNKDGSPKHPLYIAYQRQPALWSRP
jgi:hypothetical protein